MTSVQALEDLRTSYGPPTALAAKKDMDRIDAHARAFIERSPFVLVSTAREDGWPEASPRGDAPGFVAVEGARRLLLPDRPGNNRLHSLGNVVEDGRIGLLFFVPGITHTLRVYGRAKLVMDDAVRARFSVRGIPARSVLDVAVELVYFHCGKALIRSGLWDEARWPATDGLASLGAILADQIPGVEVADAEARVAESIRDRLY
ncbi:MAG TPA: MSMEG_1061 family FMN-dependent PPOX-type flavoprotein [Beijerinckiaceae bacterium]|nr:MSMEG_1061 family FMN-dependent PPOX-type flavoprotein [Beijerinckiaceae bacterium]